MPTDADGFDLDRLQAALCRTESARATKTGLLSDVTEGFGPATSPDIVMIPIGMNDDHVI